MHHALAALILMVPLLASAQNGTIDTASAIPSIKYSWKTPRHKQEKNILTSTLFEGSTLDMSYLRMSANSLSASKTKTLLQVPADQEFLFIIKSGTIDFSFGDSIWSLGPGSIALLMPDEKYGLRTLHNGASEYYLMQYRSKSPADLSRGKSFGGSFVKDWNKLTFKTHDRGGVRSYFQKPTAMCKRFEMHVTTLKDGLKSHEPHTHRAEEIILMLDDRKGTKSKTEMQLGARFFQGEAGDMFFAGSNVLHGIRNRGTSECAYFAFQFE
jgi:(S)-ureidoglycine aminohydrolase